MYNYIYIYKCIDNNIICSIFIHFIKDSNTNIIFNILL